MLIFAAGIVSFGHVPFTFWPQAEPETLLANIEMHPGVPREQTEAVLRELDRALFVAEGKLTGEQGGLIRANFSTIGESVSEEGWRQRGADNLAGMWVELEAGDKRDIRNTRIIDAWRTEIRPMAGVEDISIEEPSNGTPGREIDIRLRGNDPAVLKEASGAVQKLLERYPGVRDIRDNLPYGKRELLLELTDRGRAMGFTTENVSRQVRGAAEGTVAKRFPRDDEEIDVIVKLPEGEFNLETLRELYLRNPQGVEAPLIEIVNLKEDQGFARLSRTDGVTQIRITADLDEDSMNLNRLLTSLPEDGLDQIAREYDLAYKFRGKAEEQQRSMSEIGSGVLVALIAIYIILAWVLGSYARPFVIMLSVIPFGWVGSVLGHLIMGYDMSMMSLIGLLGLTGILVNDSIILVTTIDERHKNGEGWRSAVIKGTQDRLRAVVLTSLTTIGGLTPLLFETNMQAQFLIPVAITIVFGIAVATLIVLVVVPAFLGILDDAARFFGTHKPRPKRTGLTAPETGV